MGGAFAASIGRAFGGEHPHPHPRLLPSREKGPEPARERRRIAAVLGWGFTGTSSPSLKRGASREKGSGGACAGTTRHSPVLGWGFTLILAFSPQGRRDLSLRGNDEWYAGVVRGLLEACARGRSSMGEGGNLRAGLLVLCSEERCDMRIAAVVRKMMAGALVLSALVLLAACSGNDSFESKAFLVLLVPGSAPLASEWSVRA